MMTKRAREDDVAAPEDFLPDLPELAEHDALLRCQICSEFYDAPVFLTTCSHSFCSKCIRTHFIRLQSDSACPTCGCKADDSHIRSAPVLEALVQSWDKTRQRVLDLKTKKNKPPVSAKKAKASQALQLDSDDDDEILFLGQEIKTGPTSCPMCKRSVKNMASHFKSCLKYGERSKEEWNSIGLGLAYGGTPSESDQPDQYMKRINGVVHTLSEVRNRCQLLGLYDPESSRDRSLTKFELIQRQTNYAILHNANADKAPALRRTPKDLRIELYKQEKVMRAAQDNPPETIKGNGSKKAQLYQKEHQQSYKTLVEQAKRGIKGKDKEEGGSDGRRRGPPIEYPC